MNAFIYTTAVCIILDYKCYNVNVIFTFSSKYIFGLIKGFKISNKHEKKSRQKLVILYDDTRGSRKNIYSIFLRIYMDYMNSLKPVYAKYV